MTELIQWWLNEIDFTNDERTLLQNAVRDDNTKLVKEDYKILERRLFDMLPASNLDNVNSSVYVDTCGTNLIKQLFERVVDEDTLIITSMSEHPNVYECIGNHPHVLKLNYDMDILTYNVAVEEKIKQHKKVFIYIIGTQFSGEVTPQKYFEYLQQICINNVVECITTIDDVHGMYMVPRDYRIFDYIIGTAHAFVPTYDMGILISNTKEEFGEQIYNWFDDYLNFMDIILRNKEQMYQFKGIMDQYFSKLFVEYGGTCGKFVSTHVFSLRSDWLLYNKELFSRFNDNYKIQVIGQTTKIDFILLRSQNFMIFPERFIEGLEKLTKLLPSFME